MLKSKLLPFILFIIIIIISSCETNQTGKPHSKGKTLEIMVVTNNKGQWKSEIGDAVKEFFKQEHIGLPQSEELFTIFHLPQEAFIKMYEANRDILIIDISEKVKQNQIETKKDLWAVPQRVVKISAKNNKEFFKLFEKNKNGILKLFHEVERERMQRAFKSTENAKIKHALQQKFGISLTMPTAYKIATQDSNFIWIRKENIEDSQALIIYSEDYTSTDAFNLENIISRRNKITKRYIPGPLKGSVMIVSEEFIPPLAKEIDFNGLYAIETRGLWNVTHDYMGGPFLSYTFVDERNNKLITIDSYVYAPQTTKKEMLKHLEAIAYSFKWYTAAVK